MISEVHPNVEAGSSSVASSEWIELHNLEPHPVNLEGWTIEDAQAIAPLPNVELAAGESVLVVGAAAGIVLPPGKALIILDRPRIGTGLRNDGDRVALVNPYGVRHDAVSWGDIRWPRSSDPPNPRQSIVRTATGGQSVSDRLSPWSVDEGISAMPAPHRHPRPDTSVRIVSAMIDPAGDESETVTIRNTSDRPLITVNWTLTVNNSLIRLRSVRIEPGASYDIEEPDGMIGAGLSSDGGHLVLRDPRGNWLSTASWGDDTTFHRLPAPADGQELRFNPLARVHPRVPWFDFDHHNTHMVASARELKSPLGSSAGSRVLRERTHTMLKQDSERGSIWISEVYPNAGQGRNDPAYEWFELTNSSAVPINLNGWSIADNTSSDVLDGVTIARGTSIVIAASAQAGSAAIVAIGDGRIGNGLANGGDQLRLINPDGEVVSAISWGDDRSHGVIKAPQEDQSLHRSSPDGDPFVASPSAGTLTPPPTVTPPTSPPQPQSQQPPRGDVQDSTPRSKSESPSDQIGDAPKQILKITEILPTPLPGQAEWIELYNPTPETISLDGWTIGDLARRTELSGAIGPGAYLVITTQPLESNAVVIVVDRIGNGLNNDGDSVSIFAPDGRTIDQVRYGNEALPAPAQGLSIAIEPERWVVTLHPSPGAADVTPILEDAFRSAVPKPPVSDQDRLPLVRAEESEGVNAWMIVSFALIGVIFTLAIRRIQPAETKPEPTAEPTTYTGTAGQSTPPSDGEQENASRGS